MNNIVRGILLNIELKVFLVYIKNFLECIEKCRVGATDGVPPSVISDWSPPAHLQMTNHLKFKTTNLGVEKDSRHTLMFHFK